MVQSISFIEAGYTRQFKFFVDPRSEMGKSIRFPSSVAIIEHKTQGIILLDTGYTPRLKEITKHFPERLYTLITPITVEPEDTALEKLKKKGIAASDVNHIMLTHFHADHIAGVLDFPKSKLIFSREEYTFLKNQSRLGQVKHAFLGALLPDDLLSRCQVLGARTALPALGPAFYGFDYFGDQSFFLVPLPGHSIGHMGVYLPDVKGKSYLMIGDAAWLKSSILGEVMPHALAQALVFSNKSEYRKTLHALHEVPKTIEIVPCHCHETLTRLGAYV